MPSSWLTLIVTAGEPLLLHGSAPSPNQPYVRGGRVRDPSGHEGLLQTALSMTPEQIQTAEHDALVDREPLVYRR